MNIQGNFQIIPDLFFSGCCNRKSCDFPVNKGETQDLQLQFYIKIATNS